MTNPQPLSIDDARALLSDHIEGTLSADAKADVDALLAKDAGLAREREQLVRTLALLRVQPPHDAPADLLASVRRRLADERRGARDDGDVGDIATMPQRRWGTMFAGVVAAAGALALVIFVSQNGPSAGGAGTADGAHTAGVGGDAQAVTATLIAPQVPAAVVADLAARAGMMPDEGAFLGERRASARFVLLLKEEAAKRGADVTGFVPEAEVVRVIVRSAQ